MTSGLLRKRHTEEKTEEAGGWPDGLHAALRPWSPRSRERQGGPPVRAPP